MDSICGELNSEDSELPPVTFEALLSTEEISEDLRQENVSIFLNEKEGGLCTVGTSGLMGDKNPEQIILKDALKLFFV